MSILLAFFLMLIGLSVCLFGYLRWKGKMHGSYFIDGFFHEANYLAIPTGISSIIVGITVLPIVPSSFQLILIFLAIFVMLFGFFVAWRLFKPDWVKWVEENHKEIIPYLAVEIRDHGWLIETQADLEEWVAEVRSKHGLTSR